MENNTIKGEDNIRYNATQVAEMFDLPVSTVRHYMTAFGDILGLEYSNRMRKFTKPSLRKFEYILKLREDGMTIQQIQNYCESEDIFNEEGIIPQDKPLAVEMFTESIKMAIQEELQTVRDQIRIDVRNELKTMLEAQYQMNDVIKHDIHTAIDELIEEKMECHFKRIEDNNKSISDKINEQNKIINEFKDIAYVNMEEIKKFKDAKGNKLSKMLSWFK